MNYPKNFKHIEKEWCSPLFYHFIENYMAEDTKEIIPIERKQCLLEMLEDGTAPSYMFN